MEKQLLACVEINPVAPPAWVVIWLHGLGADGHDFEAIVPQLQLDATIPVRFVFPHAPLRPITINGGMVMRGWYDIRQMDLSRDMDTQSVIESSGLLTALIERELNSGIASNRIILAGFSQGGAIVLHTGPRFSRPLAGILALSTYAPTIASLPTERHSANQTTPILMTHGEFDPLIPVSLGEATRDRLLELNYALQWKTFPMQHEVCLEEIRDISAWLHSVMEKP